MSSESEPPGARTRGRPGERDFDARLTIVFFLVLIWTPLLVTLVSAPETISRTENRYLATWPSAPGDGGSLRDYTRDLERWFADHVGLRDLLLTWHSRIKVGWFGTSPSDKLIVGKQGWFYLHDPAAVAQYRGIARFDEEELRHWKDVLEERRDWLAARGIAFVVVLAPNKPAIYPEFMPDRLTRHGDDEQHQQLARYLERESDVRVVDLRPLLLAAKKRQRVYHRTDTHWNDIGAYLAYREILDGVAQELPKYADFLRPVDVVLHRRLDEGIGLTSMVGLSGYYPEEILELRKREPRSHVEPEHRARYAMREKKQLPLAHGTDDPRMPRALMFRDSFANALIPYLSENFSRILYVWTRDVVPGFVEREHPDVVIQQITGRLLGRRPIGIHDLVRDEK